MALTKLTSRLVHSSLKTAISGSDTAESSSFSARVTRNEATHSTNINQSVKTTASPTFAGGTITGDFSVGGTLTAQEFHTEFESASIIYTSGSHKFGDSSDDVHSMTGSLNVSGTINLNDGNLSVTDKMIIGSGSGFDFSGTNHSFTVKSSGNNSGFSVLASGGGELVRFIQESNDAGQMDFYDGGSPKIRLSSHANANNYISNGGNVGIGTNSPSSLLDVRGNSSIVGFGTDSSADFGETYFASGVAINFGYGTNANTGGIINYRGYQNDSSQFRDLTIADGKGGTVAFFDGSAKSVGIGTDSPDSTLHVSASSTGGGDTDLMITNTATTAQYHRGLTILHPNISNTHTGLIMFGNAQSSGNSGHMSFVNNASDGSESIRWGIYAKDDLMTLTGVGNVGIGTTSPYSLSNYKFLSVNASTGGGLVCMDDGTLKGGVYNAVNDMYYDTTTNHIFRTGAGGALGGTEAMRIDANGHTRFGTSGDGGDDNWGHSSYGNAEVAIDGQGGYSVLHFRGDGAGSTATRFSMGVGDTKFYMCYDDVDARHNIVVDGDGGVGIGTATIPSNSQLAVLGNYESGFFRNLTSGNRGYSINLGARDGSNNLLVGGSFSAQINSGDTDGEAYISVRSGSGVWSSVIFDTKGEVQIGRTSSTNVSQTPSKFSKIRGMRAPNILTWDGRDRSVSANMSGSNISAWTNEFGHTFSPNGGSTYNIWTWDEGPGGQQELVWRAMSNSTSTGAQGGWDGSTFYVDTNYAYVFINFVKRTPANNNGTYYFGTSGISDMGGLSTSALVNPYFAIGSTSALTANEWYVSYYVVRSYWDTSDYFPSNNGTFKLSDGTRLLNSSNGNIGTGGKWGVQSGNHGTVHRVYLYYAGQNDGTALHFSRPGVFRVDGTEPQLSELLENYSPTADYYGS